MSRSAITCLLLAVALGACADDAAPPTSAPGTQATQPAIATTLATTPAPSTSAPVGPILVEPFAPLAGVQLDADDATAVPALTAAFGPPDDDSGLVAGCPFDGEGTNERFVSWGGLTAQFRADASGTVRLVAWTYDEALGPPPRPVVLPGAAAMGGPLQAAAAALGAPIEFDEVFEVDYVAVDGLAIWGVQGAEGPAIALVGVPFVPVCD